MITSRPSTRSFTTLNCSPKVVAHLTCSQSLPRVRDPQVITHDPQRIMDGRLSYLIRGTGVITPSNF